MCRGRDRQDAKREVKEETGMAKVLPGSGSGCKLGTAMESVTSRHRAKLPRSVAAERGTTYLLRCSASSSTGGGRVCSSHFLCELRIGLVNCHGFVFFHVMPSSVESTLFRCRLRISSIVRLMS